ncbi:hypothetical protein M5689_006862 [Euphorbia peplus]|nr:hypothetical protein M5689_006862 [Euphorbia peplus]
MFAGRDEFLCSKVNCFQLRQKSNLIKTRAFWNFGDTSVRETSHKPDENMNDNRCHVLPVSILFPLLSVRLTVFSVLNP